MPYTNGIFYLDYVNGNDAARTALTGCIASNPSGTITRINKTAHGLVTGAVVDLTLFSSWLNGAWKITVVDADNFDLDTAVWQTTADNDGTVRPRGGSSWSDAWKTISSGPTSTRAAASDEIRIAKTPLTATGINATFTNLSFTVTTASDIVKIIDQANGSTWTASANITGGSLTSRKQGSNAQSLSPNASFTTGKVGYIALGSTQDFSAYTKISLWARPSGTTGVSANVYKICLCSDTTGDTIVNEINIPAIIGTTAWCAYTLDYGTALGSNIQSVAIYANSIAGTGVGIGINNIVAANNVTHLSLIGHENDCFYPIQCFENATTIYIDNAQTNGTGSLKGWSGATATAELYCRNPITPKYTGSGDESINTSGGASGFITYSGGWNTSNTTVDGYTYFNKGGENVSAFTSSGSLRLLKIKNFILCRYGGMMPLSNETYIENCFFVGCSTLLNGASSGARMTFTDCKFYNATSSLNITITNTGRAVFKNCVIANTATGNNGATLSSLTLFFNCTFRNLFTAVASALGYDTYVRNCLFIDCNSTIVGTNTRSILWSYNHNQVANAHIGSTNGANITWQTTTKQGSDPGAWEISTINTSTNVNSPVEMKIAEVAVVANAQVTVKAWMKKDHATNNGCGLYIQDSFFTLSGISETLITKANDTNWEELTLTFTPTSAGVVPIYFRSWYVFSTGSIYIGSITVTQA